MLVHVSASTHSNHFCGRQNICRNLLTLELVRGKSFSNPACPMNCPMYSGRGVSRGGGVGGGVELFGGGGGVGVRGGLQYIYMQKVIILITD